MESDEYKAKNDAAHERIYNVITDTEEITWKTIILDLIKSGDMDPWNIDISLLTKRYIKAVKELKEANLKMSGKVVLAAALLLRIKSTRLIGDDINEFDRLLSSSEQPDDLYSEESFIEGELDEFGVKITDPDRLRLVPRTPQPRKRKVSVYDLIDALDVALHVKKRRVLNQLREKEIKIPDKKMDITALMDGIYSEFIKYLTETESKVAFSALVPSESKHDKVHTFIPMLHLKNARKVDLEQKKSFDEIWISLANKSKKQLENPANKDSQKPKVQQEA